MAAGLLDAHGPPTLPPLPRRADRFRSLASSITAQQVSGRAAAAIFQRVLDTVGDDFTPARVASLGPDALRGAGLSRTKAESMVDLALHCLDGSVRLEEMGAMDDDAVIDMLVQVRGIGVWTAQMVLLFDLRRIDIWPTGDLGVRAGFAQAFDLTTMPTPGELDILGDPFSPFRSVMAWWCWRATGARQDGRAERQALRAHPESAKG